MDLETQREKEQDKIYQHLQDVLNNLISVIVCKSEIHERNRLGETFKQFTEIFNRVLNLNFIMRVIFSFFNIFSFCLLNYILYKEYFEQNDHKGKFHIFFHYYLWRYNCLVNPRIL